MRRPHRLLVALFVVAAAGTAPVRAQDLATVGQVEPVKISGTINAQLLFYDADGREPTREASSWILRGTPTLTLHGVVLPFSFTFTEQNRDFRQPLNKFGLSPYYNWATVHLGFRSLAWSPYSLGGHTMLGYGAELEPGRLRVGYVSGRFRRAIDPDSTTGAAVAPVFRRDGYAFKVGGGFERGSADLIVLRGEDDERSLFVENIPATLLPAENLVVSVVTHVDLSTRVAIDFELAQSAYTENRLGEAGGDFDKFLLKTFGFLMDRRVSTREAQAVDASVRLSDALGSLKLRYKRIDPGYRSMGAYFFNNDVNNVTVEPTLKLLQGRLRASASVGWQHDNLADNKDVRTNRTIGSVRVDATPVRPYTVSASYSNYDIDQKAGRSPIDSSTTVVAQTTSEVGLTQTLSLVRERLAHNLVLVWTRQHLDDKSTTGGIVSASYTARVLNTIYALSYVPLGLTATAGISQSTYDVSMAETKVVGPQFGLSKTLLKGRGNLSVSDAISTTSVGGVDQFRTNTLQALGTYRHGRKHRVTLKFYLHDNATRNEAARSYTENRGEIGYAYAL